MWRASNIVRYACVKTRRAPERSAFCLFRIGRDKAKSRWFSKSKSICAGWSGNVPRLCAIWTPQCGGMKGKLCFIKRKSKDLVSSGRGFYEKNVSIFVDKIIWITQWLQA